MGRPFVTRPFPMKIFEDVPKNWNYPTIRLMTEHVDEYVTQYDLFGRVDGGKNWIKIGTYSGNYNCFTENIHDISRDIPDQLKFRYIRISPKKYHNSKSMRVMIYGDIKDIDPEKTETSETVTYTIIYPNNKIIPRDPAYIYKERDWLFGDLEKNRRELKKECIQYKKLYDKNPNEFMDSGL